MNLNYNPWKIKFSSSSSSSLSLLLTRTWFLSPFPKTIYVRAPPTIEYQLNLHDWPMWVLIGWGCKGERSVASPCLPNGQQLKEALPPHCHSRLICDMIDRHASLHSHTHAAFCSTWGTWCIPVCRRLLTGCEDGSLTVYMTCLAVAVI